MAVLSKLGAVKTGVPFSEVRQSLDSGVIDAGLTRVSFTAAQTAELDPAGLCGTGYVHGCYWHAAFDFARGLPRRHCIEWWGRSQCSADSAFGVTDVGCSIWFGIIVVKMAEFCLITPPIGQNCFVVAGVRPECSVQDVFRGVMSFFIADALTIAALVAAPGIVLWLPGLLGFA